MAFTFDTVDIKTELVTKLKTELPKFGFSNVKVIKADPQSASELPCVGINRVDDSENTNQIADAVDTRYDSVNGKYYQVFGTYFQESVEIRVWHTNADERDKLYRHVKAILFASRLPLVEKGLLNITLRSGKDEQDSSMQQAPMVLYWAPITMNYLNPMNVEFQELVQPISSITPTMRPVTEPTDIP
jgi:hypothetical protein